MKDEYINVMAKVTERVLSDMANIDVRRTIIKEEARPNSIYAQTYNIKFSHLKKNISGAVHFCFDDTEVANCVAMSLAKEVGASEDLEHRDDYLCEFLNTAVGLTLTAWEDNGFSACMSPPEVKENSVVTTPYYGCKSRIVIMALDVGSLIFKVVLTDDSYNVLLGKRVLVVDDSMMIRNLLAKKLTAVGFSVETALDGVDAVEKTKLFKPELIVMDQNMPRLSGLDAIVEIQKFLPDIKVIMLSSSSRIDELNTAATLNVVKYLTKPINMIEIYREVGMTLMGRN
ncbi:response regulator [Thaumasiovibrio subtropicus]|uniref:response regulator n=1 Tax=Thaumasiovibrio subtropicus TaxID=1891207 RepID=UPI000B35E0B7|nr:response regulator [Thaumasiovibrio subtropicus]